MKRLSSGTQLLADKVRAIQLREQLSDRQMGQLLNVSRQLYQMSRAGKIPFGNKILKGISAAFPELHQDVIYFLSNDADKSSRIATQNPLKSTSEPQGRGIKRFFVELLGKFRKGLRK